MSIKNRFGLSSGALIFTVMTLLAQAVVTLPLAIATYAGSASGVDVQVVWWSFWIVGAVLTTLAQLFRGKGEDIDLPDTSSYVSSVPVSDPTRYKRKGNNAFQLMGYTAILSSAVMGTVFLLAGSLTAMILMVGGGLVVGTGIYMYGTVGILHYRRISKETGNDGSTSYTIQFDNGWVTAEP